MPQVQVCYVASWPSVERVPSIPMCLPVPCAVPAINYEREYHQYALV
jgi:hypothetical protein